MKAIVRALMPKVTYNRLAYLRTLMRMRKWISPERMRYVTQVVSTLEGRFDRTCPICSYEGKFLGKSIPPRLDAWCPSCKSVGKHRLLWLVWKSHEAIDGSHRVLHFAPEACFRSWLKDKAGEYVTADYLRLDHVDRKLNVEELDLEDESYDVIILNHVLEHVDDRKALSELYRVAKKNGRVFITIPIIEGLTQTYENASVNTDDGRDLHFGQYDHLRIFGPDFRERAVSAGFKVNEYTAEGEEAVRYSLIMGEKIFVLTKN